MSTGFFGRVIGQTAALHDGLNAIYLPAGTPPPFSEAVVREANVARGSAVPPFAILVSETGLSAPDVPVVGRNEAIRYRQGDRLAVVPATSVDIASFEGTFREAIGPGFPGTTVPGFGLDSLARTAANLLVLSSGGDPAVVDLSAMQDLLMACMRTSAELLSVEREGAASWNRAWYALVDRALSVLEDRLGIVGRVGTPDSYDDVLKQFAWASFGLPRPLVEGKSLTTQTRQLVQSIEDYWSSQEQISLLTKETSILGGSAAEALEACRKVGWTKLDDYIARDSSVLAGLQAYISDRPALADAFSQVTEDTFTGSQLGASESTLLVSGSLDAGLLAGADKPVYLVESERVEGIAQTEWMVISVKPSGYVSLEQVSGTRARVDAQGAAVTVIDRSPPVISQSGRIEFGLRLKLRGKVKAALRKVVVTVRVSSDDLLFGHVQPQSVTVHVIPPTVAGLVVAEWSSASKSALRNLRFEGAVSGDGGDEREFSIELKPKSSHRVLVRSKIEPRANLVSLTRASRPHWWSGDLPPDMPAEVHLGPNVWRLESGSAVDAPQSLLLAAIAGVKLDPVDPDDDVLRCLRGRLETVIGREAGNESFMSGLGHMILPTDQSVRIESFELDAPVLIPAGGEMKWPLSAQEAEPSQGWVEAHGRFVASWADCLELLPVEDAASVGVSVPWPSKRSTRRLATEPERLDGLLGAYAALVQASGTEPHLRRLASVYPFSVSTWTLKAHQPSCDAVLLSPWHPLRLAWLTHAEAALASSRRARALAGTIEGWRFPFVGPTYGTYGKLVAVPIEAGAGDIFAAWSMMVPISVGDPQGLNTPGAIGGSVPPGSSASGLTGSAADAAMRDFRRVNRHLSSVTIDLASSTPAQRLEELDTSVLRAMRHWSEDSMLRGVNVLDSLNRLGDIPRGEVTELLSEGISSALSWARYQPSLGTPVKSNLRLLQDSGVRLGAPLTGEPKGVLGKIPLRRFEAPSPLTHEGLVLHPAVADEVGAFTTALAAVEQPFGLAPAISVVMSSTQLLDDNADWTISGQSYVSASLLANVLSKSQGHSPKMLWEWRPPFLAPDRASPLNRRPYASVMRIGKQLVNNIADRLLVLNVDAEDGAKAILETLGSQGIGLSSLLSMGGHHAAGALGFYLSLRLMELAEPPAGWIQIVMPIDACREFLDVLAPDSKSSETRRQADLLVIRANADEVCLIPLEVKLYGLEGESPDGLPTPAADFSEPLAQLRATTLLLSRVQAERQRISDDGSLLEAALWDNALATLIESGLSLSQANDGRAPSATAALRAVVSGDYRLNVGRPLITFYRHHAGALDQYVPYKEGSPGSKDASAAYAALAARPAMVWQAVSGAQVPTGHQGLVSTWGDLVNWSQRNAVSSDLASSVEPESEPSEDEHESVVPETEALVEEDLPVDRPYQVRRVAETPTESSSTGHNPVAVNASRGADELDAHGDLSVGPKGTPDFQGPRRALMETFEEEPDRGASPAAPDVGVKLEVGRFLDSIDGAAAHFWPSSTATTQLNMGVVGDLGTGKTQLLKSLLLGLRRASRESQERPVSGLVFDYKKDFQDEEFQRSVGATLWEPHGIPLNVLELYEPYSQPAIFRRASAFASMLERIYSGVGPVQRNRLISVIMDLFLEGNAAAPVLSDVLDRYSEGGPTDSVNAILNSFVLPQIFAEDPAAIVTIDKAMEDTVLVLNLNSWGADHQMKNSLVVFFLDMFYESMKRSEKMPFRSGADGVTLRQLHSILLVDEASNIMGYDFPVLESLLKEGREFGVGTILSSQYLSHFKSKKTNFAETLSTWFIHKVPNVTPAELSSLGIIGPDREMSDRIKGLKVHESMFKADLSPARFIRETPYWELVQGKWSR